MNLAELAADLHHAASIGAQQAGAAAVHAAAHEAEIGVRVPGAPSLTVAMSGLSARIAATQKRGVYQESAPATAVHVGTAQLADTMAATAASVGAEAVKG